MRIGRWSFFIYPFHSRLLVREASTVWSTSFCGIPLQFSNHALVLLAHKAPRCVKPHQKFNIFSMFLLFMYQKIILVYSYANKYYFIFLCFISHGNGISFYKYFNFKSNMGKVHIRWKWIGRDESCLKSLVICVVGIEVDIASTEQTTKSF